MAQQFPFQVGNLAPDFNLVGDDEKHYRLSDFLGRKVILYFYPKDDTLGCTQEACDFRDHLPTITEKGAVILGVSPDSPLSHKKFKEKYQLPFCLLSDPNAGVARRFGAYGEKNLYGKISEGVIRTTFLIDERGHFLKIYPKVSVKDHVANVIQVLDPSTL